MRLQTSLFSQVLKKSSHIVFFLFFFLNRTEGLFLGSGIWWNTKHWACVSQSCHTKQKLFGPEAVQYKGQIDHQQAEQETVSPICMWSSNLMTFKSQLIQSGAISQIFGLDLFIHLLIYLSPKVFW